MPNELPPIAWIASYPKSGNTWVRHLLFAYLFGEAKRMASLGMRTQAIDHRIAGGDHKHYFDETNVEAATKLKAAVIEAHEPTQKLWPADAPEFVFMKTHYLFTPGHPLVREPGRVVAVVRHPKDVLLSTVNFEQMRTGDGDPKKFVQEFIERGGAANYAKKGFGTWSTNWRSWVQTASADLPVLLVSYEGLLTDPLLTFGQVLHFLGFPPKPQRLEFAVRAASFGNLQAMERKQREDEAGDSAPTRHNDKFFFNKGTAGGTIAETFGVDMDDRFDDVFAPQIEQFNSLAARGLVRVAGNPHL